jgi:phosphonate transport system substrate-binding protein
MWWLTRSARRVSIVLSAVVLAAFIGGCSSLGGRTAGTPDNPIRMAIVPFLESGRLVKGMQLLSDELKKETGLTYTGDVPTSYAAVVEAMCADRVDIGWVSPLAYILARQKCGADMTLVSVARQGTSYRGVVVTRADSLIKTIEDLRGKRFAWVDPGSTSGNLFPRAILQEHGLTPESLGQQLFAGGHDKAALAVLQGQVDAGAIGKDVIPRLASTYLNAEQELRIVEESADIPNDGVAFRKGLSPEIVEKTRQALLRITARPDGPKVFEDAIGTQGVAPTTDTAYEPVRRAATVLGMDLETELSKPR